MARSPWLSRPVSAKRIGQFACCGTRESGWSPATLARQQWVRYSSTLRPCCRHVSTTRKRSRSKLIPLFEIKEAKRGGTTSRSPSSLASARIELCVGFTGHLPTRKEAIGCGAKLGRTLPDSPAPSSLADGRWLPPSARARRIGCLANYPCPRSSSVTAPRAVPPALPRCSSVGPLQCPQTSTATPRAPTIPCRFPASSCTRTSCPVARGAEPLHAPASWLPGNALGTVYPHPTHAIGETTCCSVPADAPRCACPPGPGRSSLGSPAAS